MTKIVITAAGKGTRLLPFTKEIPKEMMPIFSNIFTNKKVVSPLLQYVYEQLYSMNFRDYCFIVGREKRSIEDHFTPDEIYLRNLSGDNKKIITKFYEKLEKSHLVWINQNRPLGFGDAVKRAEKYVGNNDFSNGSQVSGITINSVPVDFVAGVDFPVPYNGVGNSVFSTTQFGGTYNIVVGATCTTPNLNSIRVQDSNGSTLPPQTLSATTGTYVFNNVFINATTPIVVAID